MFNCVSVFTVAAMLLLGVSGAHASLVNEQFAVTASNFIDDLNSGPIPVDPFTATFDLTFDPSLTYAATNIGFTLKSTNFGYKDDYGFSISNSGDSYLEVGEVKNGILYGTFNPGFYIVLDLTDPNKYNNHVDYSVTNADLFYSLDTSYTVSQLSSVPLPSTLPLLGTAIAGLTGLGARKSRRNRSADQRSAIRATRYNKKGN